MQIDDTSMMPGAAQPSADIGTRRSRLIRLPEVMTRVGLSRSCIYKRMSEGRFPKSRSLSPKCAVWVEAEVDQWISEVLYRLD